MSTELKVGQKLWYVPNPLICRHEKPMEVTIKKIGRKWIEIEPSWLSRVDKETLVMDGGDYSPPGRCYVDRAAYEAEAERKRLLHKFKQLVSSLFSSSGLTTDQIRRAAEVLDINLGENQ